MEVFQRHTTNRGLREFCSFFFFFFFFWWRYCKERGVMAASLSTQSPLGVWPFSCTWLNMFYRKWLQRQLAWRFEILRENVMCLPRMNSSHGMVPFRSLLHSNTWRSLISLSPRTLQLGDCARWSGVIEDVIAIRNPSCLQTAVWV